MTIKEDTILNEARNIEFAPLTTLELAAAYGSYPNKEERKEIIESYYGEDYNVQGEIFSLLPRTVQAAIRANDLRGY